MIGALSWSWVGLMVLLLTVCLSGGSVMYAVLLGTWFSYTGLDAPFSRRLLIVLVVSTLTGAASNVAINSMARWSAEVRAWVFGAENTTAFAVGPLLVKGVLGVQDWQASVHEDSLAFTEDEVRVAGWNVAAVTSSVFPLAILTVYIAVCGQRLARRPADANWLHARGQRGQSVASTRSSLHTPRTHTSQSSLAERESESAPLLAETTPVASPERRPHTLMTQSQSVLRSPPQSVPRRRTHALQTRWCRWLRLWSLTLVVLCGWQGWWHVPLTTSAASSSSSSSRHTLVLNLCLECAALVSWWTVCRAMPRALAAHTTMARLATTGGSIAHADRAVARGVRIASWLVVLPVLTLAAARNAYLRDVLRTTVPTRFLEAILGVSSSLSWWLAWRLYALLVLALAGTALYTQWQTLCMLPCGTTASASLSSSQRGRPRSRRPSLIPSQVPAAAAGARAAASSSVPPPQPCPCPSGDIATTPERGRPSTERVQSEDGTSMSREASVENALAAAGGSSPPPKYMPPRAPGASQPPPSDAPDARATAHSVPTALLRGGQGALPRSVSHADSPRVASRRGTRGGVEERLWRWLIHAWVPLQAMWLPSIPTLVAALAYTGLLWTTAGPASLDAMTHTRSSFAQVAVRGMVWLFALTLCVQTATLSLAEWMPPMALEAMWTASWWGIAWPVCHAAQHAILLAVFCVLVCTTPQRPIDADANARVALSSQPPPPLLFTRETDDAFTRSPAYVEATTVLGDRRCEELLAFARRASALVSPPLPPTAASADTHDDAIDRLDAAFVEWLGRPSTPREQLWLLPRPHTQQQTASEVISAELFLTERAAAAAFALGHWWTPLVVLADAFKEVSWRAAPLLMTTVLLLLSAVLSVAHTSLITLLLAAAALASQFSGAWSYGAATRHRTARVLISLCAASFYVCLGVSYTLRLSQRAPDTEADTKTRACGWLQLAGLWPLRTSWRDYAPFLFALLAMQFVHSLGQHCGGLRSWHEVANRVEWHRAVTRVSGVAMREGLQIAQGLLLLLLTVRVSVHPQYPAASLTQFLWFVWGVMSVVLASGCTRRVCAAAGTVAWLCVVAMTLAIALAQLPILQDWLVSWLSASTPSCAVDEHMGTEAVTKREAPWRCLQTLGLYWFTAAPPPDACAMLTEPENTPDASWRLESFLIPWYLLCAMTSLWTRRRRVRLTYLAVSFDDSPAPRHHETASGGEDTARDVPLLHAVTLCAVRVRQWLCDWCWRPVRRVRHLLLWASLTVASASLGAGGALRLPYTICLLFDMSPLVIASYSLVHMSVLMVYGTPWVPALTVTIALPEWWWWLGTPDGSAKTIQLADLVGLHKTAAQTSTLALLACPMSVLLAVLPALVASHTHARHTDQPPPPRRVRHNWLDFFLSFTFFAMIGYELVVLCLLALLYLLQAHALGIVVMLCVLVTWRGGRSAYAMNRGVHRYVLALTVFVCLGASAAKLMYEACFANEVTDDSARTSTANVSSRWAAWCGVFSVRAPRAVMACVSALIVCVHLSHRAAPIFKADHDARRVALDGCTSLLAHIRAALPSALATLRQTTASSPTAPEAPEHLHPFQDAPTVTEEAVVHTYLPALPPAVFDRVVPYAEARLDAHTYTARLSRLVIYVLGYTSPFALLTFVAGAVAHPSLLHVCWMLTALLEVTYLEALQWRAFRWWQTFVRTYLACMLVIPTVVQVPGITQALRQHEGFFTVLGLLEPAVAPRSAMTEGGDDAPSVAALSFSVWAAASVMAVCLQERALTDVWCSAYLHRLYRSHGRRRARYEELQARIAREDEEEVASVLAYDAELRRRLGLMREYDHRHEPLLSAPLDTTDIAHDGASDWPSAASPRPPFDQPYPECNRLERRLLAIMNHLAPYTYRPEKVRVERAALAAASHRTQFIAWRLAIALYRVAESHTMVLVVLSVLSNCLVTGSVFELCGLAYLLLVVLPWYPHPPQAACQGFLLYVTAGILLKAAVSLLAARWDLPEGLLSWLSWMLVRTSHATTSHSSSPSASVSPPHDSTAALLALSSHTSSVNYAFVVLDFLEFSALTVHHYASVWNGVYRAQLVHDVTTQSEDDAHAEAQDHTGPALARDTTDRALTLSGSEAAEDANVLGSFEEGEELDDEQDHTAADSAEREEETWSPEQALYASVGEWVQSCAGHLRTYWSRMTTTVAMGTDLYTIYTCLDAVALFFVLFAYSSIADSAYTSLQDTVRNNMIPGKLVLVITASMALLVVERMLYVRRAMSAKLFLTLSTTLLYCGVYCWWRHSTCDGTVIVHDGTASGAAFGDQNRTRTAHVLAGFYFVLKIGASIASVLQIRKGFPRRRPHDCLTGHPESLTLYTFHILFYAIPFLWECRVLIDWFMMHTSLSLTSFLKVEDVYNTVYVRRVQLAGLLHRPVPLGTPVSRRTKVLMGLTRLLAMLAALLAPLTYYSTLNPAVQANPVTQLEVMLSFNGARPFYSSLIQSPDNSTVVSESWRQFLGHTRPSLSTYEALLSSHDVQRLEMTECSEELWLISPTAQKRLEAALEEVAGRNESTYRPVTASSSASGSVLFPPSPWLSAGAGVSVVQTLQVSRGTADASGSSTSALSWTTRWELPASSAAELLTAIRNTTVHRPPSRKLEEEAATGRPSQLRGDASQPTVHLPFFYTPFVSNKDASVGAYQPSDPLRPDRNRLNCTLHLRVEQDEGEASATHNTARYWCMTCEPFFTSGDFPVENSTAYPEWSCLTAPTLTQDCLRAFNFEDAAMGTLNNESWQRHQNTSRWLPLRFVTISPQVVVKLPFLSGVGIVALYTTFVLALGRLMRSLFAEKAKSVIQTDMANPAPVSQLLECIYTARECGELELEETAYLELIDLLRSPERLLAVTGHVQALHQQLANMSTQFAPQNTEREEANDSDGGGDRATELQVKKKA